MYKLEDVKFGAMVIHQGVNPSVSLSKKEFDWLIEQAEKYIQIEQAWSEYQDKETLFFLRKCKQVIENVEIPKRKSMF